MWILPLSRQPLPLKGANYVKSQEKNDKVSLKMNLENVNKRKHSKQTFKEVKSKMYM